MGQHSLPAGLQLRDIVFRNQIPFVELDHGFQLAVADGRLLILPDILAVFTLTGQIWLGEGCVAIGRNLCLHAFAVLILMDCLCRKHEACPGSILHDIFDGIDDVRPVERIKPSVLY